MNARSVIEAETGIPLGFRAELDNGDVVEYRFDPQAKGYRFSKWWNDVHTRKREVLRNAGTFYPPNKARFIASEMKRWASAGWAVTPLTEAESPKKALRQARPQEAGWDDLVELSNGAEFRTPMGTWDMWSLMGFEGLEMEDAESQTEKFFRFIMAHKAETMRYLASQGETVRFAPDAVLKAQWQQARHRA